MVFSSRSFGMFLCGIVSLLVFYLQASLSGAPMTATADLQYPADENALIIKAAYIRGTATADSFQSYVIRYRPESPDTAYTEVIESQSQVQFVEDNGILGKWNTYPLAAGYYWLRLDVYSVGDVMVASDSVRVNVTPNSSSRFRYVNTGSFWNAIPNYSDYNNDGKWEILYGSESGFYAFNPDGSSASGMPTFVSGGYRAPSVIASFNNDCIDDIVTFRKNPMPAWPNTGQRIIGYVSDGEQFSLDIPDGLTVYDVWEEENQFHYPVAANIDSDNSDEILVQAGPLLIFNVEYDGDNYVASMTEGLSVDHFIAADLDHDGQASIYILSGGSVSRLDSNLQIDDTQSLIHPGHPGSLDPDTHLGVLSACDIDLDGDGEVIVLQHYEFDGDTLSSGYYIWAFEDDLTPIASWCDPPRFTYIRGANDPAKPTKICHPVFGDVDNDSELEYFIAWHRAGESRIYAWHASGDPLLADYHFSQVPVMSSISQPLLVDVDGDSYLDVLVSSSYNYPYWNFNYGQRLIAWNYQGHLLPDFPIEFIGEDRTDLSVDFMFNPMALDLNSDGHLGVVAPSYTTNPSYLFFLDFPGVAYANAAAAAPAYRYDRRCSSLAPTEPPAPCFICGDADRNGNVAISDANYIMAYIFQGGPAPKPWASGNVDCNLVISISDVVYIVNYIFSGGPAPCAC